VILAEKLLEFLSSTDGFGTEVSEMQRRLFNWSALIVCMFALGVPATCFSDYTIQWTGETWDLPSEVGVGNGLAYESDGGEDYIWHSSWYSGQIRRLRLSDGATVEEFTSPSCGEFPTCESSGLEFVGGYLWHVTGFGKTYKLDPVTGSKLDECSISSSPRGLAWGDGHFWTADFDANTWYWFDCPGGMGPVHATPFAHPNAIAWDGNFIWIASTDNNYIYKFDPWTGAVLDSAFVWASWGIRSMQILPSDTSPWTIYMVPHKDPTTVYEGQLCEGATSNDQTTWGRVKSLFR
jgi:hypothetical protein